MVARGSEAVRIAEAAYRIDLRDHAWLELLAEESRSFFDGGAGLVAYRYGADPDGGFTMRELVVVGGPSELERLTHLIEQSSTAEDRRTVYGSGFAYSSLSELSTRHEALLHHALGYGLRDFLGVIAPDQASGGLVIGAPRPKLVRAAASERGLWRKLAAHLAAASRLRERLKTELTPAEAVFDAAGRCLDATGPLAADRSLRQALKVAVLDRQRARYSPARQSPREALGLWRAVVLGRWSLIDRFDADGRRFVVAYRNDVDFPDPRALTPTEQRVTRLFARGLRNKQIADKLGVSAAAISSRLATSLAKLGLRSPLELIQVQRLREHVQYHALNERLALLSWPEQTLTGTTLSAAERAICADVLAGYRTDEIARRRATSVNTVANQIASLFRKLGVNSRNELAKRVAELSDD